MIKNLPAMPETQVRSLGQENPLEKEIAPCSSILAWKIPWAKDWNRAPSTRSSQLPFPTEYSAQTPSIRTSKDNDLVA